MQTQSRLIDDNSNGGGAADDEQCYEAVVRELTRGHELTAQLKAEVLRVLRGHGQAEATAAFILREVSRAFNVCISIMGASAPAANAPPIATPVAAAAVGPPRARDDGVPRTRTVTPAPHDDGYEWRKYGQKRIMRTSFPRCYYKCVHQRGRSCPATKQVQEQQSNGGGPKMYVVIYVHEHTCDRTSPAEHEVSAGSAAAQLDLSAGLSRQERGGVVQLSKEELEQQALVSSLACVLQGSHSYYSGGGSPEVSSSQLGRAGEHGASAHAVSIEAAIELPTSLGVDKGLDVMDYDVTTDALYFGGSSSYGPDDDDMLL